MADRLAVAQAIAFSSITTSYVVGLALPTGGVAWGYLHIDNGTNGVVSVSYDGTNEHEVLPAGYVRDFDSAPNGIRGSVRIKYTGSAPTTGNLYLSGRF